MPTTARTRHQIRRPPAACRILGGQIHGEHLVTAMFELQAELLPAPRAVVSTMHQAEGNHRWSLTSCAVLCWKGVLPPRQRRYGPAVGVVLGNERTSLDVTKFIRHADAPGPGRP